MNHGWNSDCHTTKLGPKTSAIVFLILGILCGHKVQSGNKFQEGFDNYIQKKYKK